MKAHELIKDRNTDGIRFIVETKEGRQMEWTMNALNHRFGAEWREGDAEELPMTIGYAVLIHAEFDDQSSDAAGKKSTAWRDAKLMFVKAIYGDYAEEYRKYFDNWDDRRLFVNCYDVMIRALESLHEDPHPYFRAAISARMRDSFEIMNRIAAAFDQLKEEGAEDMEINTLDGDHQ